MKKTALAVVVLLITLPMVSASDIEHIELGTDTEGDEFSLFLTLHDSNNRPIEGNGTLVVDFYTDREKLDKVHNETYDIHANDFRTFTDTFFGLQAITRWESERLSTDIFPTKQLFYFVSATFTEPDGTMHKDDTRLGISGR
jgi:hypothetical protein